MKTPNLSSLLCLACSGAILAYTAYAQTAAQTAAYVPVIPTRAAAADITPSRTTAFPARAKVSSIVIDTTKLASTKMPYGSRMDVFNGPSDTLNTFEAHITTVNPGQAAHAPHTHGNEEMLIVKEGKLQVSIKNITYLAGPGSIIYYSPNDLHGTLSVGDVPATYYVFSWITDKTPARIPPTDPHAAAPAASTAPTASTVK